MSAAAAEAGVRAGARAGAGAARRMRAWAVHSYGAPLRLQAARLPALRAPDHLLVRVRCASLNPIDAAMIGGYGRTILNTLRAAEGDGGGVEFPLVPGRDFLGEVVRAGAGVRAVGVGARVWGVVPPHWPGAHAEYVLVRERWTGLAPAALGESAGGALYAALSATSALRAAGLRAGGGRARARRVLLLGLGAVGHAALQLLAHDGAEVVVGCAGEGEAGEAAARGGAARVLDRHAPDYSEQLVAHGPYEAIIDCAGLGGGEAGARGWSFRRFVTLSSPLLRDTDARGLAAGLPAAALSLAQQCWSAASTAPSAPPPACLPPHVRWAYFTPCAEDIELLRRRAESGQFVVRVERTFPWWEAEAAYARLQRPHARGKLLLDFTRPHAHDHTTTRRAPSEHVHVTSS